MDSDTERQGREIKSLEERVSDIEDMRTILDGILTSVGRLDGQIGLIMNMLEAYLPNINQKANKMTSFWTIVQVIGAILTPIVVALLGGYFLLKSQFPGYSPSTP